MDEDQNMDSLEIERIIGFNGKLFDLKYMKEFVIGYMPIKTNCL